MSFVPRHPFVNIPIPDDLIREVQKVVDTSPMGYRTRTEFVIEAVREKIREIEKELKSQKKG